MPGKTAVRSELAAKTLRSKTYDPMATAACGEWSFAVEMMPNGMLASEKSLHGSISGTHELAISRFRDESGI
jgi:hypothetical protein